MTAFQMTGQNAATKIFFDFIVRNAAKSVANEPKNISVKPKPPKKFANTQPTVRPGTASGK